MRRIGFEPGITYFKPAGVPVAELEEIVLTMDEFESVRLKDSIGMNQESAADTIGVSQPTFHRIISSARKKIADAVVNGKAIKIEGGNVKFVPTEKVKGFYRNKYCVCPKCGHNESKQMGIPCFNMQCPKCKTNMVRHV